jgi:tetratricopeptide (TPR) repeat protein
MVFVLLAFIKAYKKNEGNDDSYKGLSVTELAILSGLLAAYFVQNLAVFDSFATYIFIMIIMAFAHFLETANGNKKEVVEGRKRIKENTLLILFLIVASFFVFNVNFRAIKTSNLAIDGYVAFRNNDMEKAYEIYSEMDSLNSVIIRDARGTCVDNTVSFFSKLLENAEKESLEKVILLSMEFADKNLDYNTSDSMTLLKTAKIYDVASKFYLHYGEKEKASRYNMQSLHYVNLAIEASPERVPLYSYKSGVLLSFNEREEARKVLEGASEINLNMPDAFCQLTDFHFTDKNTKEFLNNFSNCVERGGLKVLGMESFVPKYEKYFYEQNDWGSLATVYKILLSKDPENISWLSNSALSHQKIGDYETAREHASKILELDSSYEKAIGKFLNELDSIDN